MLPKSVDNLSQVTKGIICKMKSSFTYFSKELTAIYSVYNGKKLETHKSRETVTTYLSHSFKNYQLMINLVLSTHNSTHTHFLHL